MENNLDQAYAQLWEYILSNPGFPHRLTAASIAKAVGWKGSRVDLQYALRMAVAHGVITKNDTTYSLVTLELPEIRRYLELRETLETYFVTRLVRRLNEIKGDRLLNELQKANNLTAKAVAAAKFQGFIDSCQRFHKALATAAAYQRAGAFIEGLWGYAWRVYNQQNGRLPSKLEMEEIYAEHSGILTAIKGRDEAKAIMAVRLHFQEIRRRAQLEQPKPFVFVLMPFDASLKNIYEKGIKSACENAGAHCARVDEQDFVETISKQVFNQIAKADVVVADTTGRNVNVLYEVGYAHALDKAVIFLTQTRAEIPFYLRLHPYIVYGGNATKLKRELERKVRSRLEGL
ncbi:MAG TPA: FCD domain-containing protein [Thermoanaerobaculia bacterium]|nr:FCD domain-containing protein [Thermoanaerobaculia bacterium]